MDDSTTTYPLGKFDSDVWGARTSGFASNIRMFSDKKWDRILASASVFLPKSASKNRLDNFDHDFDVIDDRANIPVSDDEN
jgi:hypothetical protein